MDTNSLKGNLVIIYENYKYNSMLYRNFTSGIYPTDRSYVHKDMFTEALVEIAKD